MDISGTQWMTDYTEICRAPLMSMMEQIQQFCFSVSVKNAKPIVSWIFSQRHMDAIDYNEYRRVSFIKLYHGNQRHLTDFIISCPLGTTDVRGATIWFHFSGLEQNRKKWKLNGRPISSMGCTHRHLG